MLKDKRKVDKMKEKTEEKNVILVKNKEAKIKNKQTKKQKRDS